MAIDTANKRRAMMGLGGVRRLPIASGSFDAFDRAMFLGDYFIQTTPRATIDSIQYLGNGNYLIGWSVNIPGDYTYYLWVNGILYLTTRLTSAFLHVENNDAMEVFVFIDEDDRPPTHYQRRAEIYWVATDGTKEYRIEQFVGAEWIEIGRQREVEATTYIYMTGPLDDITTYQFRVIAVGINENETVLKTMSLLMVHRPDTQATSWSYSDVTQQITITIT